MRLRTFYLALFLALSCNLFAEEKKQTVDVISAQKLGDFWGVELPTEGVESEATMSTNLYVDKNGDPIIRFSYSGDQNAMYSLLYDIGQKKIVHFEKRILSMGNPFPETKEKRYIQEKGIIKVKSVPFRMGGLEEKYGYIHLTSGYRWVSILIGDSCRPTMDSEIRVQDAGGNLIAAKTILYTSRKKTGHHSAHECQFGQNGSPIPRKITTKTLSVDSIWKVDDGTVLAEIFDAPYLIRLTPTLISPFIEQHSDIRFFKVGVLMPLRDRIFMQQLKYAKPEEDIHILVDEILFRLVQQYGENLTVQSVLLMP